MKFASVATSAIHGLADLLAAYITEVGSAARAQGELSGRSESHLLDVMMALRAEGLPFAELLQHMRAPPPGRIPANLLPGGPLSAADLRPPAAKGGGEAGAAGAAADAKHRAIAGFLPPLPPAHTFQLPAADTGAGTGASADAHAAQRERTLVRRQVERSLCGLRATAVSAAAARSARGAGAALLEGPGPAAGAAALPLSAMNERGVRYREESAGGVWGQAAMPLPPQPGRPAAAPRAAEEPPARAGKKRQREEPEAEEEQPRRLEDRPSAAAAAAPAPAPAPVKPEPVAIKVEANDTAGDERAAKRPALVIGRKSSALPDEAAALTSDGPAAAAPAPAAAAAAAVDAAPPAAAGGEEVPMSHPKLPGLLQKMLKETTEMEIATVFLYPGAQLTLSPFLALFLLASNFLECPFCLNCELHVRSHSSYPLPQCRRTRTGTTS